jgi:hypothetical protein
MSEVYLQNMKLLGREKDCMNNLKGSSGSFVLFQDTVRDRGSFRCIFSVSIYLTSALHSSNFGSACYSLVYATEQQCKYPPVSKKENICVSMFSPLLASAYTVCTTEKCYFGQKYWGEHVTLISLPPTRCQVDRATLCKQRDVLGVHACAGVLLVQKQ